MAFAAGHIPGSLSIALRPAFASWLGWVMLPDRPLVFVLDRGQDRSDLVRQALGIGYEALAGEVAGGFDAWRDAGRPMATTALTRTAAADPILDVRQASEFGGGHVNGAIAIELGALRGLVAEVPGDVTRDVRSRRAGDDGGQPARTERARGHGVRGEPGRLGAILGRSPRAGRVNAGGSRRHLAALRAPGVRDVAADRLGRRTFPEGRAQRVRSRAASAPPRRQFEYTGRTGEPLQDHVATAIERKPSLAAHFANEVGGQDPPGLGGVTDPAGKGDRGPEQVVVVVDWFAGGDPDPHPKIRCLTLGCSCLEPGLNCDRALQRARHLVERGHDPVAGVLYLASA
jgi:rhodanese-related sulfurtransferase